MNRIVLSLVAGCLIGSASLAFAADPAGAPAAPAAAAPQLSPTLQQFKAIMDKVDAKVAAAHGAVTEEAIAPELKEIDALLEEHKSEKSNDILQVLWIKAIVNLQLLRNSEKAMAVFEKVSADYPDTAPGKKAAEILPQLKQAIASDKVRAGLQPGTPFPDLQEKDTAGQALSLSKYKGKIVLVDFWATWCPPCRAEVPNVVAAYQKYHDKGFEIVGISLDDSKDSLDKYTKENKMTWAQYFDGQKWDNKLSKKYGITSIPATFLLDGEGKIIASDLRGEALQAELEKRLAAK